MTNAILLVGLLLTPAWSAPPKKAQAPAPSSLSSLFKRISNYLNAEPVRRASVSVAVAAVRGGIPTDQGENLDQRLLDRAALLRQRLLAGPSSSDAKALQAIYRALSVSQAVQASELNKRLEVSREITAALKDLAAQPPALSQEMQDLFAGASLAIDDKALVAAGWGRHCREITPALQGEAAPAPGLIPDPDTARLDEMLKSLGATWTGKDLPKQEQAEAHFLASQVYAQLIKARYEGKAESPAQQAQTRPAPAQPAAPKVMAPVPMEDDAAPAVDFNPRSVYAKASPAVVLILCASPEGSGELGSGSILDGSGRILTNAHVVIRDSTRQPWPTVRVYFKPAKMTGDPKQDLVDPQEAEVLAFDNSLDLALIKVKSLPARYATLSLGDPAEVSVGDRVAAIGHPEQGGLWTLTTGIVSTVVASLGGVQGKKGFQTDASINRGNSGGPLVDASGHIIGVNTLMSRKAADGLAITGVNYAVRADVAKDWLERKAGLSLSYSAVPAAAAAVAAPARPAAAPDAAAPAPLPPAPPPAVAAQTAPPARMPLDLEPPKSGRTDRAQPPKTMRDITPPASGRAARALPTPAPRPAREAPSKQETISESRPYDRDSLIAAEIREMEDLEKEMHEEVMKRTGRK